MTDKLQETVNTLITDLISANIVAIAHELKRSDDGKLALSMGIHLCLTGQKCHAGGKIAWARKFADEAEAVFEFEDENQLTMSIKSGDGEESGPVSVDAFKAAVKKLTAKA